MKTENKYRGGRPKYDLRTASKESYLKFRSLYPDINITFEQYNLGIRSLNHEYSIYILETGNIVTLPRGLGQVSINKKKGKKIFEDENGKHIILAVNWAKTEKEGKRIFHFNEHTDGYRCRWYWFKYDATFKQSRIWKLRVAKKNSNLLKDYLTNTEVEEKYYLKYHEFDVNHRNKYIKKTK